MKRKGRTYHLCATQDSSIARRGGGRREPLRGSTQAQRQGLHRKRGRGGANISFHPPTPLAHPHSRANAHAKGGCWQQAGEEVGWFDALALFTCCFSLFLFVCVHFITVTKNKNKNKNKKKRSFKLSAQSRPEAWKRCEKSRAASEREAIARDRSPSLSTGVVRVVRVTVTDHDQRSRRYGATDFQTQILSTF